MSTRVPDEHRRLLGKPLSDIAHIGWLLESEERALLRRFGTWLEALASGELVAITAAQERFLLVVRGEAPPSAVFELLWRKVLSARKEAQNMVSDVHWRTADVTPLPAVCPSCGMVGTNCTCGRSWY